MQAFSKVTNQEANVRSLFPISIKIGVKIVTKEFLHLNFNYIDKF